MTHDDQAPAPRGLETQSIDDDAPSSPSVSEGDFPFVDRDHYEIGEEFARGGGGRLRRARDLRLNRVVAIKEPIALSARIEQRFLREAVLTARLQHPSIVPVHEIGRWPTGEPFYAMKLVSGRSLRDVVAETTTIEQRVAFLPNVLAVTDAIAYAHSQGVIHRDLKSSNVMIGAFGETQVIDWGLAKEIHAPEDTVEDLAVREAQETNGIRGTPATMAPEQATGKRVDERTDVYGIGALLYQVLAGGAPYEGDTAPDVIARVAAEPPRPLIERAPRAPRELVAIAERAMARDPAQRYPSAGGCRRRPATLLERAARACTPLLDLVESAALRHAEPARPRRDRRESLLGYRCRVLDRAGARQPRPPALPERVAAPRWGLGRRAQGPVGRGIPSDEGPLRGGRHSRGDAGVRRLRGRVGRDAAGGVRRDAGSGDAIERAHGPSHEVPRGPPRQHAGDG